MRWDETVASRCRYGDEAGAIFGDAEILWECSTDDYQGSANLLARMPDGRFVHYEWTYGSCSGCDEWEARRLEGEAISEEMRQSANWFDSAETLKRYLRLDDPDAQVPTAQSPTAGSIHGMSRWLFGGLAQEFQAMGDAFAAWEAAHGQEK